MRFLAEFEKQSHCYIGWPDNTAEWGPHLTAAQAATSDLCRALGDDAVLLVANSDLDAVRQKAEIRTVVSISIGDIWLRDTGPIWRIGNDKREAIAFRWTGWGGRYVIDGDDQVAKKLAERHDAHLVENDLATEGGALETNGKGTVLSTLECLRNSNRNPNRSRADIESTLLETLGAARIVWVDRGLAGDHTDGHIDNLARFTSETTVAIAASDESDPNHVVHREVLEAMTEADLEVALIPSPGAITDDDGELMPASYLNFVITNHVVAVPTFDVKNDDAALSAIADQFPDRRVVGVAARALLYGGGALHCMTNNVPAL